jgi:RNA polymerase sigma-70 factor (ECF subfamily)
VLRDVMGLSNDEAAQAMGLSRSVLRHHLASARQTLQDTYAGLCALVNKQGVCWQCAGLREASPPERRGPEVPTHLDLPRRLALVREASLGSGHSKRMHDVFFRHTEQQEQERRGDENVTTDCGQPTANSEDD